MKIVGESKFKYDAYEPYKYYLFNEFQIELLLKKNFQEEIFNLFCAYDFYILFRFLTNEIIFPHPA